MQIKTKEWRRVIGCIERGTKEMGKGKGKVRGRRRTDSWGMHGHCNDSRILRSIGLKTKGIGTRDTQLAYGISITTPTFEGINAIEYINNIEE